MNRWKTLRLGAPAAACFALGFVVADRMTPAAAAPVAATQENGAATFSATEGAGVVTNQIFVIRGPKIYRIDPGTGGVERPWAEFGP